MKRLIAALILLLAGGYTLLDAQSVYSWKDKKTKYTLTIQPDMVAETGEPAAVENMVRAADPDAVQVRGSSKMRIWKMKNKDCIRILKTGKIPGKMKNGYMHIFKDQSGRIVALPGNVIVTFETDLGNSGVENILAKNNLIAVKVIVEGLVYVIQSPPGIEAINAAAAIRKIDGVKSAVPDMWKEMVKR